MVAVSRPLVAMTAVIAGGLVAVVGMAQSQPQNMAVTQDAAVVRGVSVVEEKAGMQPTATKIVAARFPAPTEVISINSPVAAAEPTIAAQLTIATEPQAAAAKPAREVENCADEHWPYIADRCLVSADGTKLPRTVRTIAIERQAPLMVVSTAR